MFLMLLVLVGPLEEPRELGKMTLVGTCVATLVTDLVTGLTLSEEKMGARKEGSPVLAAPAALQSR